MGKKYIKVNENDVPVYCPPGHGDTYNRRLLGPKEGSDRLEFIIGRMGRSGNAAAHVHGAFDQVMYMLEGRIRVTGDGPEVTLEKGDLIYFPVGCSHKVEVETEDAKFVVLYTPPREASAEAVNAG
jgi:quercetin dioxygenase-like cupin family protein